MQANGVRKRPRVPNACIRCRQQKIKCTGSRPCQQCTKRNVSCKFEIGNHKILVDASYIARLRREAAKVATSDRSESERLRRSPSVARLGTEDHSSVTTRTVHQRGNGPHHVLPLPADPSSPTRATTVDDGYSGNASESNGSPADTASPLARDPDLQNPLLPGQSASWTVDQYGQAVYLGTSSNWSFGRRVLNMVHERVEGHALPPSSLLFQGSTYDLDWNGLRGGESIDCSSLPAADYAVFLINAVKFHCSHLFHVFDEKVFMSQFAIFHEQPENAKKPSILWFIHYLLILAFGKAFIVRTGSGRSPPGAELFTRAMKLLPDPSFLYKDPVQSIEILVCAALYLQCLDSRSAAFNVIGQALRLAVEQGMHTDMTDYIGSEDVVERCRSVWWTVYVLDRRMTSLMGTPLSISDHDISAPLPSPGNSARRSLALTHHVQLCKATSMILQTVYGKNSKDDRPLLKSMKDAITAIAEGSDERDKSFPMNVHDTSSGICRLSAYLHLFHHQCLVLATRPLLFYFWQKKLESPRSFKITTEGGARSLLRVCVSSAKQSLRILKALQSQGLLDSFLPFDRDGAFSSAVVLNLSLAVDQSLLHGNTGWLSMAYDILEEMTSRGNVMASFHTSELQQLDACIKRLKGTFDKQQPAARQGQHSIDTQDLNELGSTGQPVATPAIPQASPDGFGFPFEAAEFSSSEDGLLNAHQLQSVAEAFDFDRLDYWLSAGEYDMQLNTV